MIKKILAIAWKDTIVQFSSRTHLLFMLFLPILFTFLLGNSLATGAPEAGADNRILLPIVDEDGGALSAALLTELSGSTPLMPPSPPAPTQKPYLPTKKPLRYSSFPLVFLPPF